MNQKFVLTGGTGFIGRNIIAELTNRGAAVFIVSRPSERLLGLRQQWPNIQIIPWTLLTSELAHNVAAVGPDCIIHLAAYYHRDHTAKHLDDLVDSNLKLGLTMLESARICGCPKFVHAGTGWQDSGKFGEAVNLYAATKTAFAKLVDFYCAAYGLNAISLLLSDTYGPKDDRQKFLNALRRAWLLNKTMSASGGEQEIELVHAADVAKAFAAASQMPLEGNHSRAFSLPSEGKISLRDLVDKVNAVIPRPVSVNWGDRPYAPNEVFHTFNRAAPLPNWSPSIRLSDGLRDFFLEEVE